MTTLGRRDLLQAMAVAGLLSPWQVAKAATEGSGKRLHFGTAEPFSFETLIARARTQAEQPFEPRPAPAPDLVQRIDYEAHGAIQYDRDVALYADGPSMFPVTFFHLGRFFPKPVRMHLLENGEAREVRYRHSYFDIPDGNPAKRMPEDSGFAGFRLHESRKRDDWATQDWVAFLGASYFRAIGALGQYGLSARGVTIDAATAAGEEFPDFTEFYLAPAAREDDPVTIYAVLDGPSVTGAFRFDIRRTGGVVMDVEKHLFFRKPVKRLGIAPLTSMFWYGEHNRPHQADWRPEVHDSDGLALWTGSGERIWRPLGNPPSPRASAFVDRTPHGFGLMQRDRNFRHYLDGVHYERRPSLWIEPLEDWGDGAVELIELPTNDEIHDNIVAAWRPERPVEPGRGYAFRYRMHWVANHPEPPDKLAQCVSTRIGRGGQPGKPRPAGVKKFVVEFAGEPLEELGPYRRPEPVVSASRGKLHRIDVERVPETSRWRAVFDIAANGTDPVDLRLYLRHGERPLTETWLFKHSPDAEA